MNNKQNLSVLLLRKNNILTDYTKQQTASGIDIHKLIGKLPHPRRGWVLPGHKYCGPFNPLDEQVDDNGNPKPGYEPKNQVDDICRIHDIMYDKAKNKADKHAADKVMLKSLSELKLKNFREKIDKFVSRAAIGTKYKLGLGIKQKQIVNDLFYKNTWKPSQRNKRKY